MRPFPTSPRQSNKTIKDTLILMKWKAKTMRSKKEIRNSIRWWRLSWRGKRILRSSWVSWNMIILRMPLWGERISRATLLTMFFSPIIRFLPKLMSNKLLIVVFKNKSKAKKVYSSINLKINKYNATTLLKVSWEKLIIQFLPTSKSAEEIVQGLDQ